MKRSCFILYSLLIHYVLWCDVVVGWEQSSASSSIVDGLQRLSVMFVSRSFWVVWVIQIGWHR